MGAYRRKEDLLPLYKNFFSEIFCAVCDSFIRVARIFVWGGKPQITRNDIVRNFQKRNFLWGHIVERKIFDRYRRKEDL